MSVPFFLMLMAVCCGYAFLRGGAPERFSAALQIGAFALWITLHRFFETRTYQFANPWTMAVDLALFVALIVLAWRSTRFWPLWVAGWQLAAIIAHLAKLADPTMLPAGYAIQTQFWAYPMLIATAAGAWRHQARIRSGDPDPSWKASAA